MARLPGWSTVITVALLGALVALGYSLLRIDSVESSARPVVSTAVERLPGDGAALRLDATGLPAGASYSVLLRGGTCATPSASTGRIGSLVADSGGRGTLRAISVRMGAVGEPMPLTIALLEDDAHVLELLPASGGDPLCIELSR